MLVERYSKHMGHKPRYMNEHINAQVGIIQQGELLYFTEDFTAHYTAYFIALLPVLEHASA